MTESSSFEGKKKELLSIEILVFKYSIDRAGLILELFASVLRPFFLATEL
jgi:hypothetical protein